MSIACLEYGQDAAASIHLGDCSAGVEEEDEGGGGEGDEKVEVSSIDPAASSSRRDLRRVWRQEWKGKHRWAYPVKNSEGELRLKCTWCTYCSMDNVYAREGCSTIQMSALNTHAKSESHRAAESRIFLQLNHHHHHNHHHDDSLDALYDGPKAGGGAESMPGMDDGSPGMRKRRFSTSPAAMNGGGGAATSSATAASSSGRAEMLGAVVQRNNSRVVQLLVDAESGRNARHAASVAMAKKQLKRDERRLQVEQQLLEQERARLDAHVRLGQSFIAALTDIGDGLKRIGNAMEAAK